MIRMQVQLDEAQLAWLRQQARERNVSISQLVREATDAYRSGRRGQGSPKDRARAAAGRFSSGLADVSERHDDYLAQAVHQEHEDNRAS